MPVVTMAAAQSTLLACQHGPRPAVEWHQGTRFRSLEPGMWSRLSVCRIDIKHACVARHGIWSTSRGWGSDGGFGGGAVAKKWRLWLCLRSGIGFGSGGLRAAMSEGAISSASAVCWKLMLSVAMVVSINFLPWATDMAAAESVEASECDNVSQYYSQASGLKGEKLKEKLHEIVAGHKRLSYAEVWTALKILDAADTETPDTSPDIVDIYSLKRLPKSLQGKSEGWNREHLWPRSYGLEEGRPEFTDVHNLRPADANVNSSRGNKYFGDCTALMTPRCLIPANREAAADTATDTNTWRPPTQVRGDIARAVFYMAVRYGIEQPSGSVNLQLSDSPSVAKATMGLLSTLLQWNNLDPPSSSEVLRNSRVCSLYQGNRNPFVDHPEYASSIWGAPDVMSGPIRPSESAVMSGPEKEKKIPKAWINEIHYTNEGQDQDEFIEVVVGPKIDISSLKVYLYDSRGTVYRKLPLADAAQFHSSKINGSKAVIYSADLPGGSIQNGPGDGIALVQEQSEENSRVLQFLSYQGIVTAVEGPAKGSVSKDTGVRESNLFPIGSSIGLSGAGRKYQDFKWTEFSRAASPGSVNSGQMIRS
ncbi:hypothetical protein KC19_11G172300 [Ceratodon purpureus]|uniref:Uncharacterized protein n=1 Tax=Ceratodon purpureus TaxID=3225 RepID=A0A8T0GHI4_CERPU|nr:hypothetical protein KC19_11G172300 [Ceratodon purpureus]